MARPKLGFIEKQQREVEKQLLREAEKEAKNQMRFENKQFKLNEELRLKNKETQRRISQQAKFKAQRKYEFRDATMKYLYAKPKGPSTIKSLRGEFAAMARNIPKQRQPAIDVRQILAQQQLQQQQQQRPQRRNFFEHGSELEVYGDEGLTFFDSQKRSNRSTGSLFGLGE